MTLKAASLKTMKRGRHGDGRYGLYFNVIGNSRTWVQRLTIDGKRRNFGLGPWPVVSLSEARDIAFDNVRKRHRGIDPIAERSRAAAMPTFAEALDSCIALRADGWKAGEPQRGELAKQPRARGADRRSTGRCHRQRRCRRHRHRTAAGRQGADRAQRAPAHPARVRLVHRAGASHGQPGERRHRCPSAQLRAQDEAPRVRGGGGRGAGGGEDRDDRAREPARGGDGAALPRPDRRAHVGSDRGAVERDRP